MATVGEVSFRIDDSSDVDNFISELDENSFLDLKAYRNYQKRLLYDSGMEKEANGIDMLLKESGFDYEHGDILTHEKEYIDQIFRASEKIAEELVIYETMFNELERYFSDNKEALEHVYREMTIEAGPEERVETPIDSYTDLKQEFENLKHRFIRLAEDNDRSYTDPIEEVIPLLKSSPL